MCVQTLFFFSVSHYCCISRSTASAAWSGNNSKHVPGKYTTSATRARFWQLVVTLLTEFPISFLVSSAFRVECRFCPTDPHKVVGNTDRFWKVVPRVLDVKQYSEHAYAAAKYCSIVTLDYNFASLPTMRYIHAPYHLFLVDDPALFEQRAPTHPWYREGCGPS